ncbi:MAG: lipoprotein-releasing ABC transporter ATP-binding protein LolD [Gammaproteobacteria bacterium]|nr:lipoprotein-releasing ABC transporter ATP-binding protein LolD [Gammaproteobacteria bacterium]MCH9756703.1 lipoprotein-releasing ABC transporter ATP-binding protein LolD [Gammaproteobacteria bacterium]
MSEHLIECCDLTKSYHDGEADVLVLKALNLVIKAGECLAIVGPSGAGKSTLLHLLGGLDKPTAGTVSVQGQNWQTLSEKARCGLRNQNIGFVYQFHHLLPEFSALENVAMPLLLAGRDKEEAVFEAEKMLTEVGLAARFHHKPAQLSGGERQRVAIARALVPRPMCVLADEPTGNLDRATATQVFDIMLELNASRNTALVVVTHDQVLAEKLGNVLILEESRF